MAMSPYAFMQYLGPCCLCVSIKTMSCSSQGLATKESSGDGEMPDAKEAMEMMDGGEASQWWVWLGAQSSDRRDLGGRVVVDVGSGEKLQRVRFNFGD